MPDAEVPRSLRFLVSACAFERHSYVASLVANVLDNTSPQTHLVLNYNGSRTVLRDSFIMLSSSPSSTLWRGIATCVA